MTAFLFKSLTFVVDGGGGFDDGGDDDVFVIVAIPQMLSDVEFGSKKSQ